MDEHDKLVGTWGEARRLQTDLDTKLAELQHLVVTARERTSEAMRLEAEQAMFASFDQALVRDFFREPYVTIPRRNQEWYVIAPRFINFQIGWLEKSTKTYNVFLVNKYMAWLAQVPAELRAQFDFQAELPVTVADGIVFAGKHQEDVLNRYKKHISNRLGADRLRIREGHEFNLVADMIDDGTLPFQPHPVAASDLQNPTFKTPIQLRDYQRDAWEKFLKTGAVGIFWPFSGGKTIIGIWAGAHIKGRILIVVPTTTLKEQWDERIRHYLGDNARSLFTIITYQGYDKAREIEWALTIFDECHRLPANTFARLATLRTKYRIGLSGTPYREDGRTGYIFALTGFPTGMDWHKLLELGVFKKPSITLYVFEDQRGKLRKLSELLRDPVKTIIFCDGIDLGARIAKEHEIPHVHGETKKDRLKQLKSATVAVVSRVGDEGVSLPDIRRVIEIDFHAGSRRQEAQRLGRLFHSQEDEAGEHIILMTEEELDAHEKRLLAIYEKGFNIKVVR